MTLHDRLQLLHDKGLHVEAAVLEHDMLELASRVPDAHWERFTEGMLSALEAIADGTIRGTRLKRDLRRFRKVSWHSGLPSHLQNDMRVIYSVTNDKTTVIAIGFRDPSHLQRDIYTRVLQRLRTR